jgi:hypothetical protein
MTMPNSAGGVRQSELTDDELRAIIRSQEEQDAENQPGIDGATATQALGEDADARLQALVQQALAPVLQQIAGLNQTVQGLGAQVETMRLDGMNDDEKVAYYQQKDRERQQALDAYYQQQQAAVQQQTQQQVSASDQTILNQHADIYDSTIKPSLVMVAGTYGISETEAKADLDKGDVYRTFDAQGRVTGVDWSRFQKDMTAKWQERSQGRDNLRTQNRANGDSGRPNPAVPAGWDAFDTKKSIAQITLEAIQMAG